MPTSKVKKIKARKVYTPGSGKGAKGHSPGRPKKKVQGRPVHYRKRYNEDNLQQAVKEVKENRMTLGEAAREFQVPKTTLFDRVKERVTDKSGRPTVLSEMEEQYLVERLIVLGDWGFPVSRRDLRTLIKNYLDGQGRTTRFPDNFPGKDFVTGFLARHKELTVRTASQIKRSRAAVSREDVRSFFARFVKSAQGVLPENMYNSDETNLNNNSKDSKA
jgi:transposase-like protein